MLDFDLVVFLKNKQYIYINNMPPKKAVKTYNLKKKYKFAKNFDCFEIKEYEDKTFKLLYFNKPYSEDFAE